MGEKRGGRDSFYSSSTNTSLHKTTLCEKDEEVFTWESYDI